MMTSSKYWVPLALVSAMALAGCGGGSGGPGDPRLDVPSDNGGDGGNVGGEQETFCTSESTVFEVAEFVPADGEQGVELNKSLRVTFNAVIDEASVNPNTLPFTIGGGANPVPATYNVLGTAVVINPDQNLQINTDYQVTATTGLRALCDGEADLTKNLLANESSSFTTGDQFDGQGPSVVASSPQDGVTLAPVDSDILVEFDEEIDPASVTASNFTVTEVGGNGVPVAGVLSPVGNSVRFNPNANLKSQTFYEIQVDTTIADLAGNALLQQETFTFRTGGLIVLLNQSVISQLGPLDEGLNGLGGLLLAPLAFGSEEDGLNSLDNLLLLQIPLLSGLTDLLSGAGGLGNFDGFPTTTVNGTEFTDFTSALIAVCDPKSVTTVSPSADCVVGLDLGLDLTQLQSLADAFTGGNPEQVPALIQALAESFASGDFNNLPPELSDVLGGQLFPVGDGLGVELRLVDDSSLPLPAEAEDALLTVLNALNEVPLIGDLLNQTDGRPLVDLGLLEGSLLGLDLGALASLDVLSGTEQFIGEKGVLNLGGALFDLLLDGLPEPGNPGVPGSDLPLSPEDLPLIGDLLNMEGNPLDPGSLGQLAELLMLPDDFEFDPATLPLIGDILAALPSDFPGEFPDGGADQLTLIGDLIQLLDPSNLGDFDGGELTSIPVLGDLVEQLLALSEGGANPEDLPLIGELITLFQGGDLGGDSPLGPLTDLLNPEQLNPDQLTDLFDPNQLAELPDLLGGIPVLGDLLGLFPVPG